MYNKEIYSLMPGVTSSLGRHLAAQAAYGGGTLQGGGQRVVPGELGDHL